MKLTEACRPLLRGDSGLSLRRDEDRKTTVQQQSGSGYGLTLADAANHRLWEALRSLRKKLADKQSVPPYVILHDAVLLDMVRKKPQNLAELSRLPGVGEKKLERYGAEFLAVIRQASEAA